MINLAGNRALIGGVANDQSIAWRVQKRGRLVGAESPVMLTSRADNDRARLGSCALALLHECCLRTGAAFGASNSKFAETPR